MFLNKYKSHNRSNISLGLMKQRLLSFTIKKSVKSFFLSAFLGGSWGRGTFLLLEQSDSYGWPNLFRKQEDYKTALLFLIPSHRGKRFFACNIAEDVLTQCIFILPPLFPLVRVQLFWGNMRARPHSENLEWHKHCQTETILIVKLITDWWFCNEKEILFFFLSLPIMHTAGNGRAGVLVDTELKYIQPQNMHATSKAARDICYRKDQRQHR